MQVLAKDLDRKIRIERPIADDSFTGAGNEGWELVAEVAAQVRDILPSRGERLESGINLATRPAHVRIRYREDITAAMRVLVGRYIRAEDDTLTWQTDRTAQITTPPVEMGRRGGLEFRIEDTPDGQG
jgi:head-tail adaptor